MPLIPLRRILLACLAILGLASCDNDPARPATPAVLAVRIAPRDFTLAVGFTANMVAIVDVQGDAPTSVIWSSSDEATATVTAAGVVTGVKAGNVAITATSTFDASRKDVVSVEIEQLSNLPATVLIRSVTRGGTGLPVDPQAVAGVVDVNLSVNFGDQVVTRIDVLVDDRVVAQTTAPAAGGDAPPPSAESAPIDITLSFNTAAFNQATGVPETLNGQHAITAKLTTQSGSGSGTATSQFTFRNEDVALAVVTASGGSASDGVGRVWRTGDLSVSVIPVIYSAAGVSLASALVGFHGLQDKLATGSTAVWAKATAASQGGSGGYSNGGDTQQHAPVLIASTLSNGQPGPAGAFLNAATIALRLDNRPPTPGELKLTAQSTTLGCCAGAWVGSDYQFSSGHAPAPGDGENVDGVGIGNTGITYHAGVPSLTDALIAGLPAIVRGSDLAESETNSAYTVVARVADRLGNIALVRLSPSSANALSTFGVDRVAPTFTFSGLVGVADGAINPPNPSSFETVPSDGKSGYTLLPVARRIIGNFSPASCLIGIGALCTPDLGSFSAAVPQADGSYYTFEAFLLDQAGNRSPTVTRTVLVDHVSPVIQSMVAPALLQGGAATAFNAAVADNVDLFSAQHRLEFPSFLGASSGLPFAAPEVFENFGAPRTTFSNVQRSFNFVRSMEFTNGSDAPAGILESATATRYVVFDRALNMATSVAAFPNGSVAAGSSASGRNVQQFRIIAPGTATSVCTGTTCAGGVPQTRTLTVEAAGPVSTFTNPFANGVYFCYIDANAVTRLIGTSTSPSVVDNDGIARRWSWSVNFVGTGLPPQGNVQIFAVGVDADGDGLRTRLNTNLSIVP